MASPGPLNWYACPASWSFILRRFVPRLALCSLAWELAQLPLYTIWEEARPGWIAFAVAHCTVGDVLIGTAALLLALTLCRAGQPAGWPAIRIATFMVLLAVSYTLMSERLNVAQGNWTYSSRMPVLPWLEVGISPLLQWLVVPFAAFGWAIRRSRAETGLDLRKQ